MKNYSKVEICIGFLMLVCLPSACLAGGSVSGHVENTSSQRITGAFVMAVKNGTVESSYITDSNGEYVIAGLDPNTYDLHVDASGYEFRIEPDIVVYNEKNTAVNVLNLAVEGKITGTVMKSDGTTPIGGVMVSADCGMGHLFAAFTEPNGVYIIKNLPEATYTVTARDPNFEFPSAAITEVRTDPNYVGAGVCFIGFNGVISGTITESNGTTPIAKAMVLAYDNSDQILKTAFTDPNGNYELKYFATGTYLIKVLLGGHIIASVNVSVTDGSTTDRDFSAVGGSISGSVKNSGQTAIQGAIVTAIKDGALYEAISDGGGNYEIKRLPAGIYTVTVDPNGNEYASKQIDNITVVANTETSGQNFILTAEGKIAGTVKNSAQEAIANAIVFVFRSDANDLSSMISSSTDPNGNYTVEHLKSGTYVVCVQADSYVSDSTPNVTVTAGQTTSAINFILGVSGGSISGTVYKSDGVTPIVGAFVACSSDSASFGSAFTDSSGGYVLGLLQAATYKVTAVASGFDSKDINNVVVTGTQENSGNDFTLTPE